MEFDNNMKLDAEELNYLDIYQHILNCGTVRELKGISNRQIEAVYAMGVDFYKAGNFGAAEKVFHFLVLFEHTSSKYWTAYGSVLQVGKRWDEAIKAYQMGTFYDIHNPKPAYYAAECFIAKRDYVNATLALKSLAAYAPKDTPVGQKFLAKGLELAKKLKDEQKA